MSTHPKDIDETIVLEWAWSEDKPFGFLCCIEYIFAEIFFGTICFWIG